jgi:hypothetical protein
MHLFEFCQFCSDSWDGLLSELETLGQDVLVILLSVQSEPAKMDDVTHQHHKTKNGATKDDPNRTEHSNSLEGKSMLSRRQLL